MCPSGGVTPGLQHCCPSTSCRLKFITALPAKEHDTTALLEQLLTAGAKQEIEASRERLARLKFHPREALPNITALARGEALFVELRGSEREALSNLLSAFRIALESQESHRIDLARSQLIELTAHLRAQVTGNP